MVECKYCEEEMVQAHCNEYKSVYFCINCNAKLTLSSRDDYKWEEDCLTDDSSDADDDDEEEDDDEEDEDEEDEDEEDEDEEDEEETERELELSNLKKENDKLKEYIDSNDNKTTEDKLDDYKNKKYL